jgi:hypothetical protein
VASEIYCIYLCFNVEYSGLLLHLYAPIFSVTEYFKATVVSDALNFPALYDFSHFKAYDKKEEL